MDENILSLEQEIEQELAPGISVTEDVVETVDILCKDCGNWTGLFMSKKDLEDILNNVDPYYDINKTTSCPDCIS